MKLFDIIVSMKLFDKNMLFVILLTRPITKENDNFNVRFKVPRH